MVLQKKARMKRSQNKTFVCGNACGEKADLLGRVDQITVIESH